MNTGCSYDFYGQKQTLPSWPTWRNSDVTWKLMVFTLVDMDREDQYLHKSTKHSIIGPLLQTLYGGCNNPPVLGKVCYNKQPDSISVNEVKTSRRPGPSGIGGPDRATPTKIGSRGRILLNSEYGPVRDPRNGSVGNGVRCVLSVQVFFYGPGQNLDSCEMIYINIHKRKFITN